MKEKIKIALLIFVVFIFLPLFVVQARSGCCSHHGGVCGCRCCDGTPLSAKCAPYYPQCSAPKPSQTQPITPRPTPVQPVTPQTPTPQQITPNTEDKQINKDSIDSRNLLAEVPKENNGGATWWWIIGIGFVGLIIYRFIKKKKQTI